MTTPAGLDEKSNPAKRAGTEPSVASKDDETPKALSVSSFATALGAYDWPGVQALLDSTDFSSSTQATLAEALRRGKGLFFEYPAPAKEKKRDLLLKHLVEHLTAKYGAVPEEVAHVLETLTVVEAGYRKILETLKGTDASKLEPALRVAAAMASTDRLVAAVLQEMEEQARKRGAVGQHMRVELENGSSYDPSAALEAGHLSKSTAAAEFANGQLTELNIEPSRAKANEEDADEFAADVVRIPMQRNAPSNAKTEAISVAMELGTLSWNMQAHRSLDEFGATAVGKRSVFFDKNLTHPNLDWRVLRMNYLINSSPTAKSLLDSFEDARRRGANPEPLYVAPKK